MGLYSALPQRRNRQLAVDGAVVLWIVFWLWQGWSVHGGIREGLRATDVAEQAAVAMEDYLGAAASVLSSVPLLGDAVASPFAQAADAAGRLRMASELGGETIRDLALKMGLGVALTPTILLLVAWLPRRIESIRRSSSEWADEPELLALRALSLHSPTTLRRLVADPVEGWRSGDPETIRVLAGYQVAWDGIRTSESAADGGAGPTIAGGEGIEGPPPPGAVERDDR